MKEKTTIPKRVKGTVLFTVVAVMMVLIVFLTATLALAVTANKRAYTAYQQEQTEYTAKAVLEAVNKNIADDTDGSHIRADIVKLAAGASMPLTVEINDGTATEAHTVNITNTGQKRSIYENNAWKEVGVYAVSITIDSRTTAASSTFESYLAMDVVTTPGTTTTTTTTTGGGDGGAFVSLGDTAGTEIGTHGFTTGGTYIGIGLPTIMDYKLTGSGDMTIDAPFYVNGSLNVPIDLCMHYTKPNDFMVVMGNLTVTGGGDNGLIAAVGGYNESIAKTYENTPYLYVDGKFSTANHLKFGNNQHAVNVYCGSFEFTKNSMEIYGDIYAMDEGESVFSINGGSDSNLYKWVGSTLTRVEGDTTAYGSLYSMGSLKITNENNPVHIYGDLHLKGDLTIENKGGLIVDGNIIVEGTITLTDTGDSEKPSWLQCTNGSIYAGTIVNGGTIKCPNGTVNVVNPSGSYNTITAPAPIVKDSKNYYDLKAYNGNRAVYPSNYTKANLNTNKLDNPKVVDYDSMYPISVDDLDASLFDSTDDKYKVPIYSVGTRSTKFGPDSASLVPPANPTTIYYTAVNQNTGSPEAGFRYEWDGSKIYCNIKYRKHSVSNGFDTTSDISYEDLGVFPNGTASYSSEADYLMTVSPKFKEVFSHIGPSNAYNDAGVNLLEKDAGILKETDSKGQSYYHVTQNCVMNGNFNGQNIYIDSTGGAITVIMDRVSFSNDAGIIVDDTNPVTIFVVDSLSIGQKSGIVTTDYLNLLHGASGTTWNRGDTGFGAAAITSKNKGTGKGGDVTIEQVQAVSSDKYPNVIINSEAGATLSLDMNTLVTALVRAPKMIYKSNAANESSKNIKYVLPDTSTNPITINGNYVTYGVGYNTTDGVNNTSSGEGCKAVGLIGQLVAGQIILPSNGSWSMLYITDPNSSSKLPGQKGTTKTVITTTPGGTTSSYGMLYSNMY